MSMGFAEQGQRSAGADRPVPLPVQALDHATGYLMASAALLALQRRAIDGVGSIVRASLARTGAVLMAAGADDLVASTALAPESSDDWTGATEQTVWGPARRLRWPLDIDGIRSGWTRPATPLGSAAAQWNM